MLFKRRNKKNYGGSNMSIEELITAAKALSEQERQQLIESLNASTEEGGEPNPSEDAEQGSADMPPAQEPATEANAQPLEDAASAAAVPSASGSLDIEALADKVAAIVLAKLNESPESAVKNKVEGNGVGSPQGNAGKVDNDISAVIERMKNTR